MAASIQITGAAKYVEFSAGHAIVNGVVLYVNNHFLINDTDLTGAGGVGNDFGDYVVFLKPNRNVMESYYTKNWDYRIQGFAAGVTYIAAGANFSLTDAAVITATRPDEFVVAIIQKRLVGGNTVLTGVPINRGERLIDTKDISDLAIQPQHIGATGTFAFPTGLTIGGNAAVVTTDARLSDQRTPLDLSVTPTKISTTVADFTFPRGVVSVNTPIATVTSLPGSPVDGQEIYFVADATNGVVWHLKYRAASASTYKWEFVGGSELTSERPTSDFDVTTSTSYVANGTSGAGATGLNPILITLPLAGDYTLHFGANMGQGTSGASGYLAPKLGTTLISDGDSLSHTWRPATTAANPIEGMAKKIRRNNLTSGWVIQLYSKVTAGGSLTTAQHFLHMSPVRVG